MDFTLTPIEVRVLGALIEKEVTTPEYYPLSANALKNACNQTSNRNPVVSYDEKTVMAALDQLKEKGLVSPTLVGRVPKYEEFFLKRLNLVQQEIAVICILMLRGPQTCGEIRTRTERLYHFESLEAVFNTLKTLEGWGYVTLLPRQRGRKEPRYTQLFSPLPPPEESDEEEADLFHSDSAENERISNLEAEVATLRQEVDTLKQIVAEFKKQFE